MGVEITTDEDRKERITPQTYKPSSNEKKDSNKPNTIASEATKRLLEQEKRK